MNASYFGVDSNGRLRTHSGEFFLSRWARRDAGGTFWIDAHGFTADELRAWLADFGVPPLIAERCVGAGETTTIIPLLDACYLQATAYADADCTRITSVGVVCLPNLLITVHSEPIDALERIKEHDAALVHFAGDTAHLLVGILLVKTDETSRVSGVLRDRALRFDELLDRDPDAVSADDLLDLKQAVTDLVRVSEEQEECCGALAEFDTRVLDFSALVGPLKLLTTMAASVNRRADRLATRVLDLQGRFQMAQQERGNHRLAVLTVISAVFLPLSLLAGIWGMNFDAMPELSLPHAYFGALGLMALVGGGMTWIFYKRGWF